jgi:hypothetical protein
VAGWLEPSVAVSGWGGGLAGRNYPQAADPMSRGGSWSDGWRSVGQLKAGYNCTCSLLTPCPGEATGVWWVGWAGCFVEGQGRRGLQALTIIE